MFLFFRDLPPLYSNIGDYQTDGHPHERDENGFCGTCGAVRGEPHYRCVPKEG